MTARPPPGGGPGRLRSRLRGAWTTVCGTTTAASLGLALLVFGTVAISMAVPRGGLGHRTQALQRTLAGVPATSTAVLGNLDYTTFGVGFAGRPFTAAQLSETRAELAASMVGDDLPGALAGTRPRAAWPDWVGLTSGYAEVTGEAPQAFTGFPPQMEILYRDELSRYGRLAAGHLPEQGRASPGHVVLQIAVTGATAARFGLRPGSRLGFAPDITLDVTGIVTPAEPGSAFWGADAIAAAPGLTAVPGSAAGSRALYWAGAGFVGPAEVPLLQASVPTAHMEVSWAVPLSVAHLTADQVTAVEARLSGALTAGGQVQANGTLTQVPLSSGLLAVLDAFSGEDQALGAVLGLVFVSLAAIGIVAVVLGAGLVATRRSAEFAVMRARGASLGQVAGRALIASAALTLPAATAGAALAVAVTPGGGTVIAWWLAGSALAVALAGLPLLAAAGQRGAGGRLRRTGSVASRRAAVARRVVAEAGLASAAVGGIIVLRRQGLTAGNVDVYSSAAPALVAVLAAIVVVHGYPLVLRAALRLARARPGVSAFVGLARATRTSPAAVAGVFALILALAVVAFGTMVDDAVHRAEVSQSWREVGADAIVNASGSSRPLSPAVQREIAAIPGATRTAAVLVTSGSLVTGARIRVVVLNPSGYAALIAGTPGPAFPAGALARRAARAGPSGPAPVPALASAAAASSVARGGVSLKVDGRTLRIRLAGRAPGVPGGPAGSFLILPAWALGGAPPSIMLVVGPRLDTGRMAATVRRALPGASVTFRADVLSALSGAPLPHAAQAAIAEGAAAAAAFSALILLITLLMTARSRDLTLARLATMGLGLGQGRWLVALETLPQVLAATAGGVASTYALAPLIAPSISLSAFTGSATGAAIRTELLPLAASAGGLILLSAAALAVQFLIARRRGIQRALRVGE
jgi:putative ABC transport system permease protein